MEIIIKFIEAHQLPKCRTCPKIISLPFWVITTLPRMVGIRNCALRPEIPFTLAQKPKKMETNSDALMNSTLTRCGALAISEECTLFGRERTTLKKKFMTMISLPKLTPKEPLSAKVTGFSHESLSSS